MITFRIKTGHCLELLTPEMMKLLRSNKSKIIKDKNCENGHHLEIHEIVLANCQQWSWKSHSSVLYIVVPNMSLGQLIYMSPQNFIF